MTATKLKQVPGAAVRPADIDEEEWTLRVELAAAYRLFDHLGWTELIFNHITMRLPGPERCFLINPFGLLYNEVTASNLVKIDLDGKIVGESAYQVNQAGFVIHSAIHAARDDAHCIMHTHTTTGMAVACKTDGLSPTNFYSAMIHGQVAYHDFEGITTNPDEQPRLVNSLGDSSLMILRNHGLLSCGRTIPEAFIRLWALQRACDIQALTGALAGETTPLTAGALAQSQSVWAGQSEDDNVGADVFEAMLRVIDEKDPSYRN